MSLIDLLLLWVMALFMKSRTLGHVKNVVAFVLALLLYHTTVGLLGTTGLPTQVETLLDVVISLPAGPGTEVARGLVWLGEAGLPHAITQAIRDAWLRDVTPDVLAMTLAARRIIATALLNLIYFIVLFLVVRWLLNFVGIYVVQALPPSLARGSRALGFALGLAQSIAVCAILVAIIAPLAITGILPPLIVEHLRHSLLADMLLSLLHFLNLYRL